jgi:uncharacterized protein (TIGR04540 family)
MNENYVAYPLSVVAFANELKRAVDDYNSRTITSMELRELVMWWAQTSPEKLFNGDSYNLTVKKLVGVRRLSVVDKMLDGYQTLIGR